MVLTGHAPEAGEGRARAELGSPALNCMPSREILRQRGADLLQRPVDLIAGDHKWRGDADRVHVRVLGKGASALPCLTVATRAARFPMKPDRQHPPPPPPPAAG